MLLGVGIELSALGECGGEARSRGCGYRGVVAGRAEPRVWSPGARSRGVVAAGPPVMSPTAEFLPAHCGRRALDGAVPRWQGGHREETAMGDLQCAATFLVLPPAPRVSMEQLRIARVACLYAEPGVDAKALADALGVTERDLELGAAGVPSGFAGDLSGSAGDLPGRSEEHTSELQSRGHLVCRLLLEKKNTTDRPTSYAST